jgi:hypothetical protein
MIGLVLFYARQGEAVFGDETIVLGRFGRMTSFR